jgi:hypothetical protein
MNERMTIPAHEISFKEFLLKNKRNRTILWMAGIAIVIQFCIFKYFYPYASYIHGDSFSYLKAAYYNLDINTYMVGYSRFIRLFSVFTNSDTALVSFQYLFIQSSALFLLFTLFYFYRLRNFIQIVLLCFIVFNPLLWHLGNLISSDCLFASLSLVWFTLLLWTINRPSIPIIIWHALILFLAFTVRYNALIYPFISAVVFGLSKLPVRQKVMGIGAGALMCFLFVFYTSYKYKQLTGYWQYSPFSGWQMANNAMYAYRYVDSADRKPVPKKFQVLDNMIREFFDSTRDTKKHPTEAAMASTFYMWSPGMPLFKYRNKIFAKDSTAKELKKWASMGPFYGEYGLLIIKKYPWHYLRYFTWPNANKYYAPPVEFMQNFNSGKSWVPAVAKNWFGYKSTKLKTRTKNLEVHVLDFYPILSGIINVVMLLGLLSFASLKGFTEKNPLRYAIMLGGSIWLLNAGFTIGASSAALRFQSFPIILTTTFTVILIDWTWAMANTKPKVENWEIQNINVENKISNEAVASL